MTSNRPSSHNPDDHVNESIKEQRCELKDDYDHMNDEIEYVIENVLFERPCHPHPRLQSQQEKEQQQPEPSSFDCDIDTVEYQTLSDAFNSVLLNSCPCSKCLDTTSESSSKDGRKTGVCGTYKTCPHGGNYISSCNELVLNPDRHSKDLIYECTSSCKCNPSSCDNRLVQFGPRLHLEIIASKLLHKQYALRTNAPIPRGAFVCEYAGELLTRSEAQRRMQDHERQMNHYDDGAEAEVEGNLAQPKDCFKMNYVLCLNEYSLDGENAFSSSSSSNSISSSLSSLQQTFVDPRLRGNIGRYLNHSCQPNCEILSVRVDCPIPKIAIFAKRDIDAGEELCFHYGDGSAGGGVHPGKSDANAMQVNKLKQTPCLCGADNCQMFLPNLEF